jgi:hypothetical protein
MNTVIIFGAGASKKAGAPLMAEFLDKADELNRKNDEGIQGANEAFEDVFNAISELQAIFAKSYLDIENIETLFSAVEMGILINKFSNRKLKQIKDLRKSIITVIYKTLETSMTFPVESDHIKPPEPYGSFIKLLTSRKNKVVSEILDEISFITFNYDLGLDYSIHSRGFYLDYGLTERPQKSFTLLKLHGSINWGFCQKCRTIVPFNFKDANYRLDHETKHFRYDLGSNLKTRDHCGMELLEQPVLVPPTWNKTQYHNQLSKVWQKASSKLEQAENIIIVGYSLPETDSFFKYLFALGSESSTRIKRFLVFDPDPENNVELRYRQMIGRGIENRFKFIRKKFEESIDIIIDTIYSI